MIRSLFILISAVLVIASCGMEREAPPQEEPTLSVLMRDRLEDLKILKSAIEAGEAADLKAYIGFVHGEPSREQLETEAFRAELQAFDILYATLNDIPDALLKERYELVVQSCISCHERHCPGPIRAIEALEFEPTERQGFTLF